jgi:hypothetical protein
MELETNQVELKPNGWDLPIGEVVEALKPLKLQLKKLEEALKLYRRLKKSGLPYPGGKGKVNLIRKITESDLVTLEDKEEKK